MNQWDSDALWQKAKLFLGRANEIPDRSDSQYHLWSIVALELLARAALARVHPVLNADFRGNEKSILFAFGGSSQGAKSADASVIYSRLEGLDQISSEDAAFCKKLTNDRNEELHTAALPFETMKEPEWLPRFFGVCQRLSEPRSLSELLGADIGADAESLVSAWKQEMKKEALDLVARHKKEFAAGGGKARTLDISEQIALMMRHRGLTMDTAKCPACENKGYLFGRPFREMPPYYQDGSLYTTTEYRSERFECPSCALTLNGLSAVMTVGLSTSFTVHSELEMHPIEPEHDYGDM